MNCQCGKRMFECKGIGAWIKMILPSAFFLWVDFSFVWLFLAAHSTVFWQWLWCFLLALVAVVRKCCSIGTILSFETKEMLFAPCAQRRSVLEMRAKYWIGVGFHGIIISVDGIRNILSAFGGKSGMWKFVCALNFKSIFTWMFASFFARLIRISTVRIEVAE